MNKKFLNVILLFLMFSICCYQCPADNTNKNKQYSIYNMAYDKQNSVLSLNGITIKHLCSGITTDILNNNTMFKNDNYGIKYTFYNEKNKKLSNIKIFEGNRWISEGKEQNIEQMVDFSSLPANTTSYKIAVQKETLLPNINEKIVSTLMNTSASLNAALSENARQDKNYEYYIFYEDIINKVLIPSLNLTKTNSTNTYLLDNGVSLFFVYRRGECDFSDDKQYANYDDNYCGEIIVDINGNNPPNTQLNGQIVGDRFTYYLYADWVVPSYITYKYLQNPQSYEYFAEGLKNDIYMHYAKFVNNINIVNSMPMIRLDVRSEIAKDMNCIIQVKFYDENKNYLDCISEELLVPKEIKDIAGMITSINLNKINPKSKYYTLNIVKANEKK